MRLKDEVMELLRRGSEVELAERARKDRRAARPLLARLWDPAEPIRARAARALGAVAAAHPDLGREIVRRLLWALNDESATNGVYGVPALGEIGRRAPELVAPHLGALAAAAADAGLRPAVFDALAAIAETAPELVARHLPALRRLRRRADADETALWRRLVDAAEGGQR